MGAAAKSEGVPPNQGMQATANSVRALQRLASLPYGVS
jgi:hypothetical protein